MLKKLLCPAAIVVALLSFAGVGVCASGAPIKLIMADMMPEAAVSSKCIKWWGNELEKRTNGQVKVEYYFGASLVGAYEQLTSVKNNVIQLTPYYSAYHPDIAPLPAMALLPLMNRGPLDGALKAADEWMRTDEEVQKEFKKNNVKYMNPLFGADAFMWSKVPVTSAQDLKGLSVRAFGPWLAFFSAMGSSVVSVPVPEIYNTLERGVVKATILYLTNGVGLNLFEVTEYLNTTNLGHHCGMPLVMNLDAWNRLPDEIKDTINKLNNESIGEFVKIQEENHGREMKLVKDKGMKFNTFSAEDVKKMTETAKEKVWHPYAKKLDEKGLDGSKALSDLIKITEKY